MSSNITKPIRVLSLFSGIGGLDLGFEKAPFEIVAAVDWDDDCCDTLNLNKGKFFSQNTKVIHANLTEIEPEDIYEGGIDLIIGGPPCQTFSAIGRRAGGASGRLDPRGDLFQHFCRILKSFNPRGFIFENVRGILSSNKGQDWENILSTFETLGYKLKFRVLDSAAYGVPQHRERIILAGYKDGYEFFFPLPTHGPDAIDQKPFVSAEEALVGVDHTEDVGTLVNENGKYDHLLEDIPPGSNYLFYTQENGHPEPRFAWRSRFSDFLYKANPKTPVKTIVAYMGRYSGPFHWDNRKLSIGELLRLQGFPDGFNLAGSRTSKIRQIGNSVAPVFAYSLGLAVRKTMFGKAVPDGIQFMSDDKGLSIDRRKSLKGKVTRRNRLVPVTSQLSLFREEKDREKVGPAVALVNGTYSFNYESPSALAVPNEATTNCEFVLGFQLSNNALFVNLTGTPKVKDGFRVELSIKPGAIALIDRLILTSDWYEPERLYLVWDAINIAISRVSTYSSIHELYGHFTEPHPKFMIDQFQVPKDDSPLTTLLNWMSDMKNTLSNQPMSVLSDLGFDVDDEAKLLELLRSKRIDLRTNLTNKRIAAGRFKICYPYTLPIDRRTFVSIKTQTYD